MSKKISITSRMSLFFTFTLTSSELRFMGVLSDE